MMIVQFLEQLLAASVIQLAFDPASPPVPRALALTAIARWTREERRRIADRLREVARQLEARLPPEPP